MVDMDFVPQGMIEKMASGMRFVKRAVQADLARFKAYVEFADAQDLEYKSSPEEMEQNQQDGDEDQDGDSQEAQSRGDDSDSSSDEDREQERKERESRREERKQALSSS